ncbi:MAG TPA: hypothetical protein VK211_10445, partial [Kamptonema sp.]|nr:hypothetical protein [Kamptonema sp.]
MNAIKNLSIVALGTAIFILNPGNTRAATIGSANATENILYLNSTRGFGTGNFGNFRSTIANALDNYQDGTIFDVDFVQTQV